MGSFEPAKAFMDEGDYKNALIELNRLKKSYDERGVDIPKEIYRLKKEINQKRIDEDIEYLKEAFDTGDYKKAKNILKKDLFISITCYRFASEKLGKEEEPLLPIEYYQIKEELFMENL